MVKPTFQSRLACIVLDDDSVFFQEVRLQALNSVFLVELWILFSSGSVFVSSDVVRFVQGRDHHLWKVETPTMALSTFIV